MTCLIACSRCGEGFDLDMPDAGHVYMMGQRRYTLCQSCVRYYIALGIRAEEELGFGEEEE